MRHRAYTLVEMMVVTTVLIIMAGLITPNVVAIKAGRERDEVYASVLRLLQRGRESAIADGRMYELTVNGGNTLDLQREKATQEGDDPRQAQVGQQAEMEDVEQVTLSGDISVGDVQLGGKDSSTSDFTLHFYPDGRSDGGGLELVYNGVKRNYTVTTRGLSAVGDGPLPTAAETDWEAGQYVQRGSSSS